MNKYIRTITLTTLLLLVCTGGIMALWPVRPFWVDEWFIIHNLKHKSCTALWGQLEFMQQFPRVYLVLFKCFTSWLHYSYCSLRLPSFLIGTATIGLAYQIGKTVFGNRWTHYLPVLILVSSYTFTEYYVQAKQYTMDMLLSVVGLWQLVAMFHLQKGNSVSMGKYVLICFSFLAAPFFSYTYLLVVAPVYMVVGLQVFVGKKDGAMLQKLLPLFLGAIAIAVFYIADGRQLSADTNMYGFWHFLIIDREDVLSSTLNAFYRLFAQVGSGALFEVIFGVLGIGGSVVVFRSVIKDHLHRQQSMETYVGMYCCLVVLLAMALFVAGKLPVGTPRLNAFTVPAISILVVSLVNKLLDGRGREKLRLALPMLLFAGVIGNLFTTYFNYFSGAGYKRQLAIYTATQKAIQLATERKIPMLVTNGLTHPYEQATRDAGAAAPAVWVLQTFPAYDMQAGVGVYAIGNMDEARTALQKLPIVYKEAIVGDGVAYRVIKRE